MVHITGGGFYENVPRMYKKGANLVSVIKKDSWEKPAIFAELERRGADPLKARPPAQGVCTPPASVGVTHLELILCQHTFL